MLTQINLSLSSACGADCLYCPKSTVRKVMPAALACRVVDEVASERFRSEHAVSVMEVGENGDAFLNPECLEILRYIRTRLPGTLVEVFTNFQHLTPEKAEIILRERLIHRFKCNIDASGDADYLLVKGLKLSTVRDNVLGFLEARRATRADAPLSVHVLTPGTYERAVRRSLGVAPLKARGRRPEKTGDDFEAVKAEWAVRLDPATDHLVNITSPTLWAERPQVDPLRIDYRRYRCPKLPRVEHEAFIGPDGTWYACCLDTNFELRLGDLHRESLADIFASERRRRLIDQLRAGAFAEIGGPCRTVNCCQQATFDDRPTLARVLSALRNRLGRLWPRSEGNRR